MLPRRAIVAAKERSGGVRAASLLSALLLLLLCGRVAESQSATPCTSLENQLQALSNAVNGMQQKLSQSQAQVEALKAEVEVLQAELDNGKRSGISSSEQSANRLEKAVADLKDQDDVLQSEIAVHEQTKLESSSKYPLKVTGLLLFSSFLNNGEVDSIDDPVLAVRRVAAGTNGSLAATARQSILGLEATGPSLWNAKSSADFSIDFFGGLAYSDYSTSAGIVRLRTAHARLDWPLHAAVAEIDTPIISPLSPTSFVGVGEPALAWSGNLWAWSPQLAFENQFLFGRSKVHYDFALIDPSAAGPPTSYGLRQPDAAEQSRQPGYEFHAGYSLPLGGHTLEVGGSGYYSRQAYSGTQHVDSWAGTTDWMVPLSQRLELSGEFYRGRAIGGLGGGAFKDISSFGNIPTVHGVDAAGGWAQMKLRFPASLEANFAFGQDSAFANDLYYDESATSNPYSSLARNRAATGNIVFRPKTYLLFSTEFRYLQSWPISGPVSTAPIIGFAAGYLF
jgi:archaellum component FlaC